MVTRADLCPPTEVWLLAAEEQELNKRGLVWNRSSVGQTDTALLSVILSHKFNWNNQSWCPQSLWLVKDVGTCIVWSCVVIQCVLLWKQSTPGLKVNKILELWCKKGSLLSVIVQGWESNLQSYKIAHKRKIVQCLGLESKGWLWFTQRADLCQGTSACFKNNSLARIRESLSSFTINE